MSQTHDSIMTAVQTYSEENAKFSEKGVKHPELEQEKLLLNWVN